jgi:hypothetical protein
VAGRTISLTLVCLATAIVTAFVIGLVEFIVWSQSLHGPQTPLFEDLQWSQGPGPNPELTRRLLERVPLGSPETKLLFLLDREGFSRGWEPSSAVEHRADLRWSDLACAEDVEVTWKLDPNGRLTALEGDYGPGACL